jgi:hypothetical protein
MNRKRFTEGQISGILKKLKPTKATRKSVAGTASRDHVLKVALEVWR